jgi:hypothetical protein
MPSKRPDDSPLAALAAQRKPTDQAETVDIDVSEWYGEGAALTLRRLSAADKWSAGSVRAKAVKGMRPSWPDALCALVATLATAHVAPEPGGPGPIPFYLGLADDTDDSLILHINEQYQSFVDPSSGMSLDEQEKVLLYCCLTYLHRHPSELTDLDASALDDLLTNYRRELEGEQAKAKMLAKQLGPLAALLGLGGK